MHKKKKKERKKIKSRKKIQISLGKGSGVNILGYSKIFSCPIFLQKPTMLFPGQREKPSWCKGLLNRNSSMSKSGDLLPTIRWLKLPILFKIRSFQLKGLYLIIHDTYLLSLPPVGATPYKCKECHKEFGQKTHLFRHQAQHKGEKNWICGVCENQGKYYATFQRSNMKVN